MGASARYGALGDFQSGALNTFSGSASVPMAGGNWDSTAQAFNANLSKSIYSDNITTVQPASAQILIIVKI